MVDIVSAGGCSCILPCRCECPACSQPAEAVASEDQLRQEAFSLAQEVSSSLQEAAMAGATSAQLTELVARAERLGEIRARLQYKLVHQLDTLDMVFSLAMMAEDWEKVTA